MTERGRRRNGGKVIERPEILTEKANELEDYYKKAYPRLAPLVKQCFLNTIDTTVKRLGEEEYFVITGDIEAMWLRDSSFQVMHYVPFAAEDEKLRAILRGIIGKQAEQILTDPYANAFNEVPDGRGHQDKTELNDWVWERKYELDSLCAPLYLAYSYWKATGCDDIFTAEFEKMLAVLLSVVKTEQAHENSPYTFERFGCVKTDTLPCGGLGNPVAYTGMSWSGFRPSDDCCTYGYLIPANMMAVVALGYAAELVQEVYQNHALAEELRLTREEISRGIEAFGIVDHPRFGKMYAYETDGLGHYNLMDDANSPSLLAMPYLKYCGCGDQLYQNTRKFILSEDNPYYYRGACAEGVGSPHTPKDYIWHIGIVMRALTSVDREEILGCLEQLAATHAGLNYMHESFHKDDPGQFTRSWFAWANSLFSALMLKLKGEGFFEERS